jgi:exodeoxyribonuclease-5
MILTKKQEEGLKIAVERFNNKEKYTCISGYAGSGKSTLVRFIIQALNVAEEDVCYATFTGKAAQVLLKKGNKNVRTLHKLLYQSFPRPDGSFYRKPVPDVPYRIVVVDEVSMAPKELMKLLFSYKCHVICLGDPFQLPPVDKDQDNGLLANPHIFLDEIMRQAAESEIIQLTMAIREGRPIPYMDGKEVKVVPKASLTTGMMTWADQIICGTNATRISLNNQMRDILGRSGNPQDGDKVIALRNEWNYQADNEDPLVNGTIGYIKNAFEDFVQLPYYFGGQHIHITRADFESDSGANFCCLGMDTKMIMTGQKCVDWKTEYKINKNKNTMGILPLEFTYGYAITCHKSQGSEWDKVLVIEEKFPFEKEEHARWLYTACTRASEKLVLVR